MPSILQDLAPELTTELSSLTNTERQTDWRASRITLKTKVKEDVPTIYVRETVFGLAGSLSFITGLPKVGKTAIIAPIVATSLLDTSKAILQIRTEYSKGKSVFYIDTEQTESRLRKFRERVLKLAKFDTGIDCNFLETLSFLHKSPAQRVATLKQIFEDIGENLFLIIIDGLTDLLSGGVNDEQGSTELIQFLMKEAGRTGATIVSIIHENRGSSSARGHIGAEAERKAASMLSIRKDREKKVHVIESKLIRYGRDFDTIFFHWCDVENDFVELNELQTQALTTVDKEAAKIESLKKAVKQAFATSTELTKPNAINNLLLYADTKGKSEKTGQRLLQECIAQGFLEMKDEKTVLLTL